MEKRVIWREERPVILYGAAHVGTLVLNRLRGKCKIAAFIDKRADEMGLYEGLPVCLPASDCFTEDIKRSAIVIVCVKNIFDHEQIAFSLVGNGFQNIVFCPVDGSRYRYRSEADRAEMAALYHCVVEGYFTLPQGVPRAPGLLVPRFVDSAVLDRHEGGVTALIPAMFLYNRLNGNGVWADAAILSLFPYFALFESFSGNIKADISLYLDAAKQYAKNSGDFLTTPRWEANVIHNRRMAYERMRVSDELSNVFFARQAISAGWNKAGGYFNMNGGKHRTVYQIHQRRMYVPLRLTEADYAAYLNQPAADKAIAHVIEMGMTELPYPVLHPYFANVPYDPASNYCNLLYAFTYWLSERIYADRGKTGFRGLSVLDATGAAFPLACCMEKLGCRVEYLRPLSGFDALVSDLYHMLAPSVIENNIEDKHYDIAFILTEQGKGFHVSADYYLLLQNATERQHVINDVIGYYNAGNNAYVCAVTKGGIHCDYTAPE